MNLFPRATLRCITEDLGLAVPVAGEELISELDHPLLREVAKIYAKNNVPLRTRILSIDDNIFFRCKPNIPFRAAVWEENSNPATTWVVAGAKRENGSKRDFYEVLCQKTTQEIKAKRTLDSGHKPSKKTDSDFLKPQQEDYDRLLFDEQLVPQLVFTKALANITDLARQNLFKPCTISFDGNEITLTIKETNNVGEIFLHLSLVSGDARFIAIILKHIRPDLEAHDWQIEPSNDWSITKEVSCYTLWEPPWQSLLVENNAKDSLRHINRDFKPKQ